MFLNPDNVLQNIELKKNFVAADFGSGSGGWVMPLAEILEQGKVYAVDILAEPLSALKSKVKSQKLSNVETVRADVEKNSKLLSNSCDLVLMTNLLFETDNREKVITEGKRVLKKGGQLLIVDWEENAPVGPKQNVDRQEIKKIAESLGFKLEKDFTAGAYHWALVFKK